jgi:hypothetical protein
VGKHLRGESSVLSFVTMTLSSFVFGKVLTLPISNAYNWIYFYRLIPFVVLYVKLQFKETMYVKDGIYIISKK